MAEYLGRHILEDGSEEEAKYYQTVSQTKGEEFLFKMPKQSR